MIERDELPLLWTGFMTTLSGIGLARFAYTALMPQMVDARWFNPEQVAYLGAANLLGYLFGALAAAPLAERLGFVRVLAACWAAVALSFAACSQPFFSDAGGALAGLSFGWFFAWRCISGIGGAILMVLGPSLAMSAAPAHRRPLLGPLMFCGIGCGALLSATLIPVLARWSLSAVWWSLTASAALAGWYGLLQARRLPQSQPRPPSPPPSVSSHPAVPAGALWSLAVVLVFIAYMGDAFGYVPHTVFWVDYLARELRLGAGYASLQWAVFGLGAVLGPLAVAFAATRRGWWTACTGTYIFKTVGVALPLAWLGFAGHALSSLLVGALSPGLSAVTSGYLMQLVGPARHKLMWGYATAAFALMQAIAGYFMAWLYARWGSYQPLFLMGAVSLVCASSLIAASRAGTIRTLATERTS